MSLPLRPALPLLPSSAPFGKGAPICPRRERIHKALVHDYDGRGRQRLRCKGQLLDLIPVQ
jgi:hypothetical protein